MRRRQRLGIGLLAGLAAFVAGFYVPWVAPRLLAQACTLTPNLLLCKGARGQLEWDLFLNNNFDLIDAGTLNTTGGAQTKTGNLTVGGLGLSAGTLGSVSFVGASGFLSQDNANLFWDDTNNRLGIATASPSYSLHVAGTARVSGFVLPTGASSGYVLTSDGSGVATWQANAGGGGGGWTDGGATVHLTSGSDSVSLHDSSAAEKLDVGGGVTLGEASSDTPTAGVIEWDGTNFRGYTGSTWKNLDEAGGGGGANGWSDGGTLVVLDTANDDVGVGGAGTSTQKLQITPEGSQTALGVTGYSLTGSATAAMVALAGTWNTSGVPTLLTLALTDTASGAASKLVDLLVGGTSRYALDKTGASVQGSGATLDYETTATAAEGLRIYRGNGTARTDVWRVYNDTGVLKAKKDAANDSWLLTTGGLQTLRGSNPAIGFDGAVDWYLGYDSGYLSVVTGALPGGVGSEVARFADAAVTLFEPLVATGEIGSSLIPTTTDTYDLGSPARLWNQGFVSNLNALIFAEQTLSLVGGWFRIGYDQGSFAADVTAIATTIDFGKTMTVGHFVEVRGYDTAGVLRAEYLQVGSLVSGTTYNVTRGLNGVSPAWAKGVAYAVNGTTGNGRIDLNAYDTPRISLITQGASYNTQTEVIRIGDLNGMPTFASPTYGIYIGDASSYLKYAGGTLTVAGNGSGITSISGSNITTGTLNADNVAVTAAGGLVNLDSDGVTIAIGSSESAARSFGFDGLTNGGRVGLFASESASVREVHLLNALNTGDTADSARVRLQAEWSDGSAGAEILLEDVNTTETITFSADTFTFTGLGSGNFTVNTSGSVSLTGAGITLAGPVAASGGSAFVISNTDGLTVSGQHRAKWYRNTTQTLTTATLTDITFTTASYSTGGWGSPDAGANYALSGGYLVVCTVTFLNHATGIRKVVVKDSGTEIARNEVSPAGASELPTVQATAIVQATAPGTFSCAAYQNSGGNLDVYGSGADNTSLMVVRLW